MSGQPSAEFDSVHAVAYAQCDDHHSIEPITEPDFDELDRRLAGETEVAESTVSVADASSAIIEILQWATCAQSNDATQKSRLAAVGARVVCARCRWYAPQHVPNN